MTKPEELTIRCRRLGHDVPLGYCLTLEGKTVCRTIRDCWWQRLDIDAFLRDHLTPQEIAELSGEPHGRNRLENMIDLARKFRQDKPAGKSES